mmetsp:Transcript_23802/g.33353  ORF Transcript_23802/g.33353 Transcript_23802/m.33353 type:complete len:255 (+) Transcript_23802:151-915(+)
MNVEWRGARTIRVCRSSSIIPAWSARREGHMRWRDCRYSFSPIETFRNRNFNSIGKHLLVQKQIKAASSKWRKLPQHDVFSDSPKIILFSKNGGLKQNLSCFFKRASHKRPSFNTINTMTCDRHQVSSVSHHIGQDGKMAIVDVRTIERDHSTQLFQQSCPDSFNTQYLDDFNDIIRYCSSVINFWPRKHTEQVDSFSIQNPFFEGIQVFSIIVKLIFLLHFFHENLLYALDSLQRHFSEHVRLDLLQKFVIVN